MWQKIVQFMALAVLAGCDRPWVYSPISFECVSSPVVVLAPQWKEHDLLQLEKRLQFYEIPVTTQTERAVFEITCDPIKNDSFDRYSDFEAKSFYRNYHSSLHVVAIRLETKEIVLDTTVHAIQTLKDSPHVYQDSEIAQADVIWQQQLELFDKVATEIKSLCAFTPSGNS